MHATRCWGLQYLLVLISGPPDAPKDLASDASPCS